MRPRRPLARARRGAVLPMACLMLTVVIGGTALAIDLARVRYTADELQAAADAAALAAMRAKQYSPIDWAGVSSSGNAVAAAQQVAAMNRAAGAAVQIADADVLPVAYDPTTRAITSSTWSDATQAIQVTARATPRFAIAQALGLTPPQVSRTATAWLANVNGGNCVRPLAIGYTRFYETGVTWDRRYSSQSPPALAPDFNLWDIANTKYGNLPQRTWLILPPNAKDSYWAAQTPDPATSRGYTGFNSWGNWQPVDYAGNGDPWRYGYGVAGPDGSSWCSANVAKVGDLEKPFPVNSPQDSANLIYYTNLGMAYLCNRTGNANNAFCYNSQGTVGVKTRIMFTDSLTINGVWTHRVRQVGYARVICYFQSTNDVCADNPMNELAASGTWTYWGPMKGYPAGTMVIFLDTPGSTAITPDMTLGTLPSLTQRVLLAK